MYIYNYTVVQIHGHIQYIRRQTSENQLFIIASVTLRSALADSPDGVVAARLGPLHDRHPLVVVAEEGEVEVGAAAVRLGADGQLAQQAAHRLRVPAVLGVDDGVFEPGGERQHVARWRHTRTSTCHPLKPDWPERRRSAFFHFFPLYPDINSHLF